jgi:tRNA (mo5U34)-methyltransferase
MPHGATDLSQPAPDPQAEVAAARWYHGMRLPGGIMTAGDYDMEDAVRRLPLPASLEGRRCLDVGTRDGFFAFEMERRGAAEVVAIDLDDPARLDFPHPVPALDTATRDSLDRRASAFHVAHRLLDSRVVRRDLSVYDLSVDAVGEFDFVFVGTLLLHLSDPVGALRAVRGVLRGELLSNDAISIPLTLTRPREPAAEVMMLGPRPFWWMPNAAARRRIVQAAGFEVLAAGRPYLMRYGDGWVGQGLGPPGLTGLATRLLIRRGAPHAWVLARPA